MSNLRQLGLAMQNYESMHGMFPPDQIYNHRPLQSHDNFSGFTFLLPFLEQRALYDSINMGFACIEDPETPSLENRTARNTRLATLLCPSDGEGNHLNSYRFNKGRYVSKLGHLFDGPFNLCLLPRPSAIRDGLSQTAFVSERLGGTFNSASVDPARDVKYPFVTPPMKDDEFIPYCLASEPDYWLRTEGRYWFYGGFAFTNYNHNAPPNDGRPSCGIWVTRNIGPGGLRGPRSYHSGSVNVLFGDGRVQVVTNNVQTAVWSAMGTYEGND